MRLHFFFKEAGILGRKKMAIDFTLSSEQKDVQRTARDFAQNVLKPIAVKADRETDAQESFVMSKPAYEEAYKLGFATGFLPSEYGGADIDLATFAIAAEEICAADPGFAATLLVNGLALMPIVWFGTEEQKQKFVTPATQDPTNSYLAGYAISEPGGTANYDHPGAHPAGHTVTAEYDKANGEYIINGTKYWPTNSGGWDLKGANINMVTVRVDKKKGGADGGMAAMLVPRGTPGVTYKAPVETVAHRLDQNNWIEFENCRVPEENAFCVGTGDKIVSKAFTWSGPIAAIASVGVARAAYEWTLEWAKNFTGGGSTPIINHQNVGYMLTEIALNIEAARYMCWKTAHYLDNCGLEGHGGTGAMAKIFAPELMLKTVWKCMQVVGVNSLDLNNPLEKYMRDALVFPLYDAGNMGMQRRKLWGVMADDDFNPRAFVDNEPIPYKRSMQGYGTLPANG